MNQVERVTDAQRGVLGSDGPSFSPVLRRAGVAPQVEQGHQGGGQWHSLTLNQLYDNERAAYAAAYGKLSEQLSSRLRSAGPDELIHVWISVEVSNPPPQQPSGATGKELAQSRREQTVQKRQAWKPTVEIVAQRATQLATDGAVQSDHRWVYAKLRPDAIRQLEALDEVRRISKYINLVRGH